MKKRSLENQLLSTLKGYDAVTGVQSANNDNRGIGEKATFDIKVQRLTAAIAAELPFMIFGGMYAQSGYVDFGLAPAGMTLLVRSGISHGVVEDSSLYGVTDFIFTQGANTDIVRVTSGAAASYPALLAATASDVFVLNNIRVSLSDATLVSQYNTSLAAVKKTIFGRTVENDLSQATFKKPEQFQSGIIDIPVKIGIDKESALRGAIIATAGFQVTYSIAVERFERFNASSVL